MEWFPKKVKISISWRMKASSLTKNLKCEKSCKFDKKLKEDDFLAQKDELLPYLCYYSIPDIKIHNQ